VTAFIYVIFLYVDFFFLCIANDNHFCIMFTYSTTTVCSLVDLYDGGGGGDVDYGGGFMYSVAIIIK
jgi:hypothetical protein